MGGADPAARLQLLLWHHYQFLAVAKAGGSGLPAGSMVRSKRLRTTSAIVVSHNNCLDVVIKIGVGNQC
jgi:hypothetical protein